MKRFGSMVCLVAMVALAMGCDSSREASAAGVPLGSPVEKAVADLPPPPTPHAIQRQKAAADPLRGTPLEGRVDGIYLAEPVSHGKLTVYPVVSEQNHFPRPIQSVITAMQTGTVRARQIGDVRTIALDKTSDDHVFTHEGELFSEADQDRMSMVTSLLPARYGSYRIPVYCVELGREQSYRRRFKPGVAIAPLSLRRAAARTASQSAVWKQIDRENKKLGVYSSTKTIQAAYRGARFRTDGMKYVKALEKLASKYPKSIGVVVAIGGTIVGADLYANHGLFAQLWPRLLRSYALDAINPGLKASTWHEARAAEFLQQVGKTSYSKVKRPGIGQSYVLFSPRVQGNVLVAKDAVVHLSLFPQSQSVAAVTSTSPAGRAGSATRPARSPRAG